MEKKIEFRGYVNRRSLGSFIEGRTKSIIVHNDKAIVAVIETEPFDVTLSPIQDSEEPDYEAIFHEIYEGAALFDIRGAEKYDEICEGLLAKHTPQAKPKPEGE